MNFTKQGFFRVDYGGGKEAWAGRLFDTHRTQLMGNAQFFPWLYIYGYARVGSSIYYDPDNPFSGDSRSLNFEITLQPSAKLNQSISVDRATFNRASTGDRVYAVDIFNLKTTYQFSSHFFKSNRAVRQFSQTRSDGFTCIL